MLANDLPIYTLEPEILAAWRQHRRVLLSAPTGSGKSTQVPQMLVDRGDVGDGQVVVLQPRRLAARLLASRVAKERGVRLGSEVGYQVRLDDVSSAQTRIKYVTEGILLRRLIRDPALRGVSAVLFDEFHERHLYGDISLARILDLQDEARPDLKVAVMSATLAMDALEKYLAPCARLQSEGRTYPVEIEYATRSAREREGVWDRAVRALEEVLQAGAEGDALIFMPGAYEIHRTLEALKRSPSARGFLLLPLHGELSPKDQDAAVGEYGQRKIIVSTNVAETSLTIQGIRIVIDSGLARMPRFDPHRGIDTLLVEKISRASADQRAGRAGRTAPGRCLRLWTEREQRERAPETLPEIRRMDLSEVTLSLKAAGVEDLNAFRWLEAPPPKALAHASQLLADLGALDVSGALTDVGRSMLSYPVHPRFARMLHEAGRRGCVQPVALIAAISQGRDLLVRSQAKEVRDQRDDVLGDASVSDFYRLARAYRYAESHRFQLEACREAGIHAGAARQVGPLRDAFVRIARREGLSIDDRTESESEIRKCLLAGFADQVARRLDRGTMRCELVHGRKGVLDKDSAVGDHAMLVAARVSEIEGKELRVVLSLVTAIEEQWLEELFPGELRESFAVRYDAKAKRVLAEQQWVFRDLVLRSKSADPPADQAAAMLAAAILSGTIQLSTWNEKVEQWVLRVKTLAEACPELGISAIGEEDRRMLLEQFCLGASSYKQIRTKPVLPTIKSWLSPGQESLLDQHAPAELILSNGKKARVFYAADRPPRISRRVQDLYDVERTPTIAMGRVPLVVEILAPNFRPVQTTEDLAGFWCDTYPEVKKEMQRRYPKHEWR